MKYILPILKQKKNFVGALSKIVFHTGIISLKLFDVFAKTLCQLMVSQNEPEQFIFTLLFDKSPPQEGSGEELDNNKGEGIFYRFQFNVDEEFFLTIPISGEKIKVKFPFFKTEYELCKENYNFFFRISSRP